MALATFVVEHFFNDVVRGGLEECGEGGYLFVEFGDALFEILVVFVVGGKGDVGEGGYGFAIYFDVSVFDGHGAAVVVVLQLEEEAELEGVYVGVFAVEVAIVFLECGFEGLDLGAAFAEFFEVDIEFVGFTTGLEFFVCCRQFFTGVAAEAGPVEDKAHVTGLYLIIILLLFANRSHGFVEILPLGEFKNDAAGLENAVEMAEEIGKFKAFFAHLL